MTLDELYDLLESTSYYSAASNLKRGYSKSYPSESAAVEAYFRTGGTRPPVVTRFGRFLLNVADAIREDEPPPPPPPSSLWDRFLQWYKTEPGPLTYNKVALTESDARALIRTLQTGDVLDARNLTFSRSSDGTCLDLHNPPACIIDFRGSRAIHTGRTDYPVVNPINWHPGTRVYGLDISGPQANQGILAEDSRGLWWGFKIHDTGGTGLMTVALDRNDGPYDYRGEITQAGLRLDLDPHSEKGTGVHGAYIGGSSDNLQGNSGTFVLYVHDQPHGAAIQLGSYVYDSTIVCWAERITFNAQTQVAGNALQWWGGNLKTTTVPFVYGRDLAGRVVETDGTGGADTPIIHEYGRGDRVCLNPRLSNVGYAPKPNFVYQDCEATYA